MGLIHLNLLLSLPNVQNQELKIPDLVQIYLNLLLSQNLGFQNTGLGSDSSEFTIKPSKCPKLRFKNIRLGSDFSIYIFNLVWRGADDVRHLMLRVIGPLLGQRPRVLSLLLLRPSILVICCGIPTQPTELVWLQRRYVDNILNLFINIL